MNNVTSVLALNSNQALYPIGPNKDSYYINTRFRLDVETGEIETESEVIKNWSSSTKKRVLLKGNIKDCIALVKRIEAASLLLDEAVEPEYYFTI